MQKVKRKRRRIKVKVFNSFKEQEEADIKYYRRLSPEKKLEEMEQLVQFYYVMKYGDLPRFRRVSRIVKRKWS